MVAIPAAGPFVTAATMSSNLRKMSGNGSMEEKHSTQDSRTYNSGRKNTKSALQGAEMSAAHKAF